VQEGNACPILMKERREKKKEEKNSEMQGEMRKAKEG